MIDLQTVFDRLWIIVGAPGLLAAFDHAVNKLLFRHLKTNDMMDIITTLLHKLFQSLGLRDSARKTVENHSPLGLGFIVDNIFQNLNH